MPSRPTAIPKTYADLRRRVKYVLFTGRREIEEAWVHTYHEIGRLINEHILQQRARADYGAKVYIRLATDTGISSRTLRECAQFQRCFPIVRALAQLGWNQCRLLSQVDDAQQRERLANEAMKSAWTSPQVEARVRALNAAPENAADAKSGNGADTGAESKPIPILLTPKLGIVGRYRVITLEQVPATGNAGGLCVDLGFKLYLPLSPVQARHRSRGEIVKVDADAAINLVEDGKPSDLFTYRATVRRVIDGDTLEILVALPHLVMREKLRLRGIDCPEMDTAEGKAAKRFVEGLVAAAEEVTIVTSKVDKYDRYLADVFLRFREDANSPPSTSLSLLSVGRIFLNNHLLEKGHAKRFDSSVQDT